MNNMAVLRRGEQFDYCPLFDFGAGLLSMSGITRWKTNLKRWCVSFGRGRSTRHLSDRFMRLEAAYGVQLEWDFDLRDIGAALAEPLCYYAERDMSYIRDRVATCIKMQQVKIER